MTPARLWKAARHSMSESASGKIPLPPFARLHAEVSLVTDQLWQRGMLIHTGNHLLPQRIGLGRCQFLSRLRIVASNSMLVRIQPRNHGQQGRAAQRHGCVTTTKHSTSRSQLIQMRRLNNRMTHHAVVSPCLIVRQDHDNIRRPLRIITRFVSRHKGRKNCVQAQSRKSGHP